MVVRRIKTYTAETGFVYQYYFVGKREALPGAEEGPACEYIFDVTPDRKSMYAVSVFLQTDATDFWAQAHGRALSEAELYAAAKLRLLQGLDEIADIRISGRRLLVSSQNIEEVLEVLELG
jgi:hypothetical protein